MGNAAGKPLANARRVGSGRDSTRLPSPTSTGNISQEDVFEHLPSLVSVASSSATPAFTDASARKASKSMPLEEHATTRRLVRRLFLSSTSTMSDGPPMQAPSILVPVVTTAAKASAAPPSSPSPSSSCESNPSVCSAFSLHSAESTQEDAPRLPRSPLGSTALPPSSEEKAWGVARPTASTDVATHRTLPLSTLRRMSHEKSAGASANSVAEGSESADLPDLSSRHLAEPSLQPSHSNNATPLAPVTSNGGAKVVPHIPLPSPRSSTAAAMQSVSSVLLDMSFDSRVLVADNSESAAAEIQRIGLRLRALQKMRTSSEGSKLSTLPSIVAETKGLPIINAPALATSADSATNTLSISSEWKDLPSTATASSSEEKALTRERIYEETSKYMDFFREIQQARSTERAGYTWFRQGVAHAREGATEDKEKTKKEKDASLPVATHGGLFLGSEDSLTLKKHHRHSPSQRRGRDGRLHWAPYECSEFDSRTTSSKSPVCFCGYQSTSVFLDELVTLQAVEPSSALETHLDDPLFIARQQPPVFCATNPDLESPPLPSVVLPTNRGTTMCAGSDHDSAHHAVESNGVLSSSCGTASPSGQSFSSNSLSFCPVHVTYRPPSILKTTKGDQYTSTPPSSCSLMRQSRETLQGDEPAVITAGASPIQAGLSHQLPLFPRLLASEDTLDAPRSKRLIIDQGVPHRKQLAKRALEDNKLFFELYAKKKLPM